MTRRFALPMLMGVLAIAAVEAQEADPRTRVLELVNEGQELADAGNYDAAMERLLQALRLDPNNPSVHAHLGYLYELEGDTLAALGSYGRLLELRPDDEYGRARIVHGGSSRADFKLSLLQSSPVSFVTDECRVRLAEGLDPLTLRLAYTRGVLYPEEMGDQGPPLEKEIPSAGRQGVVGTARFNRVSYGFTAMPEGDELRMNAMVYFPSPLLSEHQADYSGLAGAAPQHPAARDSYSRVAWGPARARRAHRAPVADRERAYGLEQHEDDISYDVARDRQPIEWLREVTHEWGHFAPPAWAASPSRSPTPTGAGRGAPPADDRGRGRAGDRAAWRQTRAGGGQRAVGWRAGGAGRLPDADPARHS